MRQDDTTEELTSHTSRAPSPSGYILTILHPDGPQAVVLSSDRPNVIGRGSDVDVFIDDGSVSRKHATLEIPALVLTDLSSSNGTRVEGAALTPRKPVRLSVGQSFHVGAVRCQLTCIASPSAAAASSTAIIVRSPLMLELYTNLTSVAPSRLPVLILGETGVGKDVLAREVHARSTRAAQPFLSLNCAALPSTILDGELFGYEKGAFTGANEARPGLFESANGGTVFLDELGEMPLEIQAKLLRVLESAEVLRLGSRIPKQIDVRFVAATNRDLSTMVAARTFREDLYYRLNGITLEVPPLRERREEIMPIAEALLARLAPTKCFSESAKHALAVHSWPGNVRELRNVVERAVVLSADDSIAATHIRTFPAFQETAKHRTLPAPAPEPIGLPTASTASLGDELRELERTRIAITLERTGGNQTQAARILGMSRFTLMKRLSEYGMVRPRKGTTHEP